VVQEGGEGAQEADTEVAKPQVFDRAPEKISEFVMVYMLYLRIRMRGVAVEEQIQWILSYM